MRLAYWQEAVECAFEDADIDATPEQTETVAAVMDGAHECFGMAYPTPERDTPEVDRLRRELAAEEAKVVCPECKGSGEERTYGGTLMAISECWKCHGTGRVTP